MTTHLGIATAGRPAGRVRALLHRHPIATDVAIALTSTGLTTTAVWVTHRAAELEGVSPGPQLAHALGWCLLVSLPHAIRRHWPTWALLLSTTGFVGNVVLEVPDSGVTSMSLFFALASSGIWLPPRRRNVVRGIAGTALAAALIFNLVSIDVPTEYRPLITAALTFTIGFNLAFFATAWLVGDVFRTRRDREAALVERTQQLEIEREERARRAVVDERVRIARELHDVVAHHVSVMGVQAGGARRVLDRDPAAAARALSNIETSSRQAIDELRRLVEFLRTDGDVESLMPQPGIERIDELVDDARATGLGVELHVTGEPRELPGSIDVSAYRVVQEALTNTRKHAGASSATITIRHLADALEIEVVDDGRATATATPATATATGSASGTGHGLIGMRERLALHGGDLEVGPRRGGGYGVRARFPVRSTS